MVLDARSYAGVLREHAELVFGFCYRVTNSTHKAAEITREVFIRAYSGRAKQPEKEHVAAWLLKIAVHVLRRFEGKNRITFEILDDTIRGDPTQVTRTGALTDPDRQFLLWELRQGCMTAVLNCLSRGERTAFVVSVMMKMPSAEASATLDITPSALKVRLSRAKKKVSVYLAPRCEHVHPDNPCRCPSRLGVALRKGFIQDVTHREVSLRKTFPDVIPTATPLRDVVAIYENLPAPVGGDKLLARLEKELLSGSWEALI